MVWARDYCRTVVKERCRWNGCDFLAVSSFKVTTELKKQVTVFTYCCTEKKTTYLCRDQERRTGQVKLKPAYSLPPSERMMIKLRMNKAVPHSQS